MDDLYCFPSTYEPYDPMDPIKEVIDTTMPIVPCKQCGKLWSYSILRMEDVSSNDGNFTRGIVVKCTGCNYSIDKLKSFSINETDSAHLLTQTIFKFLQGKPHRFKEINRDTETRLCICKICEKSMNECFLAADALELEECRKDHKAGLDPDYDDDWTINWIKDERFMLMDNLRSFYLTMLINNQ